MLGEYRAENSAAKWVYVLVEDSVARMELWKALCLADKLAAYLASFSVVHSVDYSEIYWAFEWDWMMAVLTGVTGSCSVGEKVGLKDVQKVF